MSELKDLMSKFETSTPYNEPTPFTPVVEEEVDTQAILNHFFCSSRLQTRYY